MDKEQLQELLDGMKNLSADFEKKQAEAKEAAAKALEEIKANGKATEEAKQAVTEANAKVAGVEERLRDLEQKADAQMAAMLAKHTAEDPIRKVLETDSFKSFAAGESKSAKMEIDDIWSLKAVTTADASAGAAVTPHYLPGIYGDPDFPLTIRSLLAPGTTSAQLISYVKEGVFTDNTGMVAEGAQKPKSDLTLVGAEAKVRKIAALLDVSMEALEDIPFLESYLRSRMIRGLLLKEDEQLLSGDGTGENILGIMPQAAAFDEALLTQMAIQNPTILDRLFAAVIQVTLSQYVPSAFVLNPIDYGAAVMRKTNDGAYLMVSPTSGTMPPIWGLPVAPTMNMAQGQFLTGAFRTGAQIFDRKGATITMSEENNDNFEKNMFTLRIEERLALAVYSENAFVTGPTAAPVTP